jgi:Domain of unknown function (DUF4105)
MNLSRRALLTLLPLALSACATTPRNDRAWYPYLERTTHVALSSPGFTVSPVLDWSYNASGPIANDYTQANYEFYALRNVWFVLEPQPGSKLAAHTFLIFEFAGDRMLGVTIEARRETTEKYSALAGLFNRYELAYMWGSPRDLLTRRAVMLDHETFVYPLALKEEWKRDLLTRMLQRTQALETHPRWYNTLTSNCTNEIAKATDLKWDAAFLLTGLADDHLYKKKLIPGPSFEEAHKRSDMTAFVKSLNDAPKADFDRALLMELRKRNP